MFFLPMRIGLQQHSQPGAMVHKCGVVHNNRKITDTESLTHHSVTICVPYRKLNFFYSISHCNTLISLVHLECFFWEIVPPDIYIYVHSHSMMNYLVTAENILPPVFKKQISDGETYRTCAYCLLADCLRSHFGSLMTHKMPTLTASNHKANNHLLTPISSLTHICEISCCFR